jgi:hypothetical protein
VVARADFTLLQQGAMVHFQLKCCMPGTLAQDFHESLSLTSDLLHYLDGKMAGSFCQSFGEGGFATKCQICLSHIATAVIRTFLPRKVVTSFNLDHRVTRRLSIIIDLQERQLSLGGSDYLDMRSCLLGVVLFLAGFCLFSLVAYLVLRDGNSRLDGLVSVYRDPRRVQLCRLA